jgi:hypothetical protein
VENCEEANKHNGKASSSNQMCNVYKMFNTIIVVLRHEPKYSPGSALRCFSCVGDDCRDPYTPIPSHEVNCPSIHPFCEKVDIDNGKWLHNRNFNIYIRQSQKFSQNI